MTANAELVPNSKYICRYCIIAKNFLINAFTHYLLLTAKNNLDSTLSIYQTDPSCTSAGTNQIICVNCVNVNTKMIFYRA